MGKYAELLTKQTAQVIELLKVVQKQKDKDSELSAYDLENITKAIGNDNER